jgi:3-hydroxybutyryl-CoA dehydratase
VSEHAGNGSAASAMDWSAPFDGLRVGQALRTHGRTVTETDVVGFAALTGDWHPQHSDVHWASRSRFGDRIAHGMLILSYAVGLMPFDPERVVALRRLTDVVFKRALRIGETISADGVVDELSPLDEQLGLVGCTWSIRNQDGALVCRARIDVLWRRGSLAPPAPGGEIEPFSHAGGVIPC